MVLQDPTGQAGKQDSALSRIDNHRTPAQRDVLPRATSNARQDAQQPCNAGGRRGGVMNRTRKSAAEHWAKSCGGALRDTPIARTVFMLLCSE